MESKPSAVVIANPYEGRIAYFLAGLSHFYKLTVYLVPDHIYSKESQVYYKWLYSKDTEFIEFKSPEQVINSGGNFDAAFFHAETFNLHGNQDTDKTNFFKDKDEAFKYLKKLKVFAKKLYYIEMGEIFFFSFPYKEFWDLVDGVIKHHVFKKEYAHLIREDAKQDVFLYNSQYFKKHPKLLADNSVFQVEDYYHKIFPLPFPPSVLDQPKNTLPLNKRLYDFSSDFRYARSLRCFVAELFQNNLGKSFGYSCNYEIFYKTNRLGLLNFFNRFLISKWKITRFLSYPFYGKYHYPKLLYVHHLKQTKNYLGLGLFYSSYRTADCWSYGTVLLAWSHDKIDYGVPMIDGYNYVSMGEREEISQDNLTLPEEQKQGLLEKAKKILSDHKKQEEIVQNGYKTYSEYFRSPEQLVKKIFIQHLPPDIQSTLNN